MKKLLFSSDLTVISESFKKSRTTFEQIIKGNKIKVMDYNKLFLQVERSEIKYVFC